MKTIIKTVVVTPIALALSLDMAVLHASGLSPIEELGEALFHDTNLSAEKNQACVSCHDPKVGWTSPDSEINEHGAVMEGSIPGEFGDRKPPSSAYANISPRFYADFGNRLVGEGPNDIENNNPLFFGGNFWDGRATGWKLGDPAADQSQGPFLNPVEHALPNPACVVSRVCGNPDYTPLFNPVWGPMICQITFPDDVCVINDMEGYGQQFKKQVSEIYDRIAISIAAFEGSKASNAFSSKVDAFRAGMLARLQGDTGPRVMLTKMEDDGRLVFRDKAKCVACHTGDRGPGGPLPLLTNWGFNNLGVPRNPENPFSAANPKWQDPGLGGFLETVPGYNRYANANLGKVKVTTIRNVALGSCEPAADPHSDTVSNTLENGECDTDNFVTKAYMHNGYFKSLKSVVHFYNTRDIKASCESMGFYDAIESVALANDCWPKAEVSKNIETAGIGNLGLTDYDEWALVAFMQAFSDGYTPGYTPAP